MATFIYRNEFICVISSLVYLLIDDVDVDFDVDVEFYS